MNSLILKEYLLDIIRYEFLDKIEVDFLTKNRIERFQFIYDKNYAYKQYYKSLKKNELDNKISKLMEVTQVLYDNPSSVLKAVELQKLSLQSELKELFSAATTLQKASSLNNVEKQLDKIMKQRENLNFDSKGSCFGRVDACDCSLF